MPHNDHNNPTGPALAAIRREKAIPQAAFWDAIGVKQPTGCGYESGKEMPEAVRRLAYLHYVVGIPTDAEHEALVAIGEMVRATAQARRGLKRAENMAASAAVKINEAQRLLTVVRW